MKLRLSALKSAVLHTLTFSLCVSTASVCLAQQDGNLFQKSKFRKIVPGVEITINPEQSPLDQTSIHDLVELSHVVIEDDPNFPNTKFDWTKRVEFTHDIWSLELTFKPIRFIDVDVPGPHGKFLRKKIWYMVYRVKNNGQVHRSVKTKLDLNEEDPESINWKVGDTPIKISELVTSRYVDFQKKTFTSGKIEILNQEDLLFLILIFMIF